MSDPLLLAAGGRERVAEVLAVAVDSVAALAPGSAGTVPDGDAAALNGEDVALGFKDGDGATDGVSVGTVLSREVVEPG
ncbi:hypothetical protein GCM10027280_61130 [Micromonospora polyrhachis]